VYVSVLSSFEIRTEETSVIPVRSAGAISRQSAALPVATSTRSMRTGRVNRRRTRSERPLVAAYAAAIGSVALKF
jgi:hypothetical protein